MESFALYLLCQDNQILERASLEIIEVQVQKDVQGPFTLLDRQWTYQMLFKKSAP